MVFGNCNKNAHIQVQIEGVILERVHETKFLGIIIDNRNCWKPHITHVQTKLSKNISVLAKVKHILNNKSLHILYNSLVSPYLTHCSLIWGNTYKSSLQLYRLQKQAIRIIHNVSLYKHTNQLLLKTYEDAVEFKIA